MNNIFQGIWPAMLTPLDASGRPAMKQIDRMVNLFASQELPGIYILGSSGQGLLFSIKERQAIAKRVVETAAGRIPVMVHVGAVTTDETIILARHARLIGADAVSSIGPAYYRLSAEAIFEHYHRIGEAADLPFFVYQIDLVSQPKLPVSEYIARVLKIPNIIGMKITQSDLNQFGLACAYSKGRLRIFSGADQLVCQALLSGADGAIGFFFNLWGAECQAACDGLLQGQVEAAQRFMLAFQVARFEAHEMNAWAFMRAAMQQRFDIDVGKPRNPLGYSVPSVDDHRITRLLRSIDHVMVKRYGMPASSNGVSDSDAVIELNSGDDDSQPLTTSRL